MRKYTYVLETPFTEGDVVSSILDNEVLYIVRSFEIMKTDNVGVVIEYGVHVVDSGTNPYLFFPHEIKISEESKCHHG